MLKRFRTKVPDAAVLLLLMLVMGLMVGRYFGPVISQPNNYLFAAGGDGLKTYYSSSWYVKHNPPGATHSGFAYPHGNHVVYADLNPLLSGLLRWVNQNLFDLSDHVLALINYTLILSFFPCAFFLYLILRKHQLSQLYAFAFALVITWLSPQIDRFTGHYALSYLFFVPMLWYFLIRMFEGKKPWLWLGLYGLSLLVFEFAHPYHFLVGAGFLYAFLLVHVLQHLGKWRKNLSLYLAALLVGIAPIVILLGWQKLTTTTATDFVKYPFGFTYYLAGLDTVFFPARPSDYRPSPLWEAFRFTGILGEGGWKDNMEGSAYVGLAGLAMLGGIGIRILLLLVQGLRVFWQEKTTGLANALRLAWQKGPQRILRPVLPQTLGTAIWAGVMLFFVATGWLFLKVPALLEAMDFLRQFRSLGRLAWPFFYTFMVLCAWYLYAFYRRLRMQQGSTHIARGALLISLLLLLMWGFEARILALRQSSFFLQNTIQPNYPDWRADYRGQLAAQGLAAEDFQAILALPFYHIGSEKIIHEGWHASFYSKAASLDLGLPIVNNYVARAPLSASLETIQLLSDPLIPKPLIEDFPNTKPLLLLYTYTEEAPPENEAMLIDQSELIFQQGNMHFASLPLSAFADRQAEAWQGFEARKDSLYALSPDLLLSDSSQAVLAEGFGDALFAGDSLGGQAKTFAQKGRLMIWEGSLPGGQPDLPMELTIWVKCDVESGQLPDLICQQFEGEEAVSWDWVKMNHTTDIMGSWARISLPFVLKKPGNRLKVFCDGSNLTFDNLLIRPQGVEVYLPLSEKRLVLNNFLLKRE
jgi:hypothetical protein